MHQIRFRPGSAPDTAKGGYSALPDPLAGLRGPTSKGRGGKGIEEGRDGKRGDGKEVKGRRWK